MSKATVVRRGTAMPDSDVAELVTQHNLGAQAWVLSSPTLAVTTTTYSAAGFYIAATNRIIVVATQATGASFSGITIVTGNVVAVAVTYTASGTNVLVAGATAGSWGVCTMPTVPSTSIAYGMILLKASGTSGFTGGATVLDGTNASAVFINLVGPSGFAQSTAAISLIPG